MSLETDVEEIVVRAIRRAFEQWFEDFAPKEPRPALLDRNQLARELGVSLATIDRLRREGMPTVWVLDAPRFELAAVLTWLRTRAPAAP